MTKNIYNWKRFWSARDAMVNLSDVGYLLDPDSRYGEFYNPSVQPFTAISKTRCLILLGEPGIGKSVAIKNEYDSVVAEGVIAFRYDLKAFQTDTRLESQIFANQAMRDWMAGTQDLHLFLDSYDECSIRKDTLSALLLEQLQRLPQSRLFVRIACRTADWPNSLEEGLIAYWGKENVGVYELAPLRRRDVEAALHICKIDSSAFFREVDNKNVIPFAIKPITLDLLINLFQKGQQLPKTQAEIYRQGCQLLCSENNEARVEAHLTGSLSPEQCLMVASRIAAVSIFANRYAIWTGVDRGNVPDEDVPIRELAGNSENIDGKSFAVTSKEIEEALATGLFSSRGPHRLGWAHQSYAEFLAAYYLASKVTPLSEIENLIVHPGDPSRRLVPQLQQTAAWLASMLPELSRNLLKTDPETLLLSDVTTADESMKADLTAILLDLYGEGKLRQPGFQDRKLYRKLIHPGLATQLQTVIQNKTLNAKGRYIAIDIAEACELNPVLDSLVAVALDRAEIYELRTNAAWAISRYGDDISKARLKPLALGKAGEDPHDELKGCGLTATWPAHLSADELFETLTPPKDDNFLGAYDRFLRHIAIHGIQPADLPTALRWIEKNPTWTLDLSADIAIKALQYLENEVVLTAWLKAMVARSKFHHSILAERATGRGSDEDILPNETTRRVLLIGIVNSEPPIDDHAIFYLTHYWPHIPTATDVPWLLEQLGIYNSAEQQQLITDLIWWAPYDRNDSETLESFYYACEKHPIFASKFRIFFSAIDIASPEAVQAREYHLIAQEAEAKRQQQQQFVLEPPLIQRIVALLDRFEAGDVDAWWLLTVELTLDSTTGYYGNYYEPDLHSLSGWQSLDEETHSRIVGGAREYIKQMDPSQYDWVQSGSVFFPVLAGYKALYLLLTDSPDIVFSILSDEWIKWIAVIITYPYISSGVGEQIHKKLIRLAYEKVPSQTIQALLDLIDSGDEGSALHSGVYGFDDCWDTNISTFLIEKLRSPTLKLGQFSLLLRQLAKHKAAGIFEFCQGKLALPLPVSDDARRDLTVTALTLIEFSDECGWSVIWQAVTSDEQFGESLISALVVRGETATENLQRKLSESDLANLYVWLIRRYPPEEDPNVPGVHAVTPREGIKFWREAILRTLVMRGTAQAGEEIARIAEGLPNILNLETALIDVQDIFRRKSWAPVQPSVILRLSADISFTVPSDRETEGIAEVHNSGSGAIAKNGGVAAGQSGITIASNVETVIVNSYLPISVVSDAVAGEGADSYFGACIVRVFGKTSPVGAGFLIDHNHLVTCAHVVADALGLSRDAIAAPIMAIQIDFPLVASQRMLDAQSVVWLPADDLAILEILGEPPLGATAAHLVSSNSLWGKRCRAMGFPDAYDDGVWSSGVLRDRTAAGLVQIDADEMIGYAISRGFSGSPVWSEEFGGVVGMVVATDRNPQVRSAFVTPISRLMKIGLVSIQDMVQDYTHIGADLAESRAIQARPKFFSSGEIQRRVWQAKVDAGFDPISFDFSQADHFYGDVSVPQGNVILAGIPFSLAPHHSGQGHRTVEVHPNGPRHREIREIQCEVKSAMALYVLLTAGDTRRRRGNQTFKDKEIGAIELYYKDEKTPRRVPLNLGIEIREWASGDMTWDVVATASVAQEVWCSANGSHSLDLLEIKLDGKPKDVSHINIIGESWWLPENYDDKLSSIRISGITFAVRK